VREIIKVYRGWYPNPDEDGKSIYRVKYRARNGLLYVTAAYARDELDAAMQVIKKEQTNGNHC